MVESMQIDQMGPDGSRMENPIPIDLDQQKPIQIMVIDHEEFYEEFELFN